MTTALLDRLNQYSHIEIGNVKSFVVAVRQLVAVSTHLILIRISLRRKNGSVQGGL